MASSSSQNQGDLSSYDECKWQENEDFCQDLKHYVASNMKRSEILDFVKRDYRNYPWSIPTLDRRLRYYGIRYIDHNTPVPDVINAAVKMKLDGGGKRLGYRSMNLKLRTEHGICVPRKLVGEIMWDLDPEGSESRKVLKKKKTKKSDSFLMDPIGCFLLMDMTK